MEKGEINLNGPEGRTLFRSLYAYSSVLFRRIYKREVNERGKSFTDYVNDAIEKHIKGEDNFDPTRSTLDFHLKKNVIRQAIYNDRPAYVKKQLKKTDEEWGLGSNIMPSYPVSSEGTVEADVPEIMELDQKIVFDEIAIAVTGDNVLENFYLAICEGDFSLVDRAEICAEFKMSESDFDNGKRRMKTILKNVFTKYNIDIRLNYGNRKKQG